MTIIKVLFIALAVSCCTLSLHGFDGCKCIRTTPKPLSIQLIEKLEVIPISGHCRRTEIIITKKSGSKVCANPNTPWMTRLLNKLQGNGCVKGRALACGGRHLIN